MKMSLYRYCRLLNGVILTLVVCAGMILYWAWFRLGDVATVVNVEPSEVVSFEWPEPTVFIHAPWWVMERRSTQVGAAARGPLAQRFRLAGTFFAYPGEDQSVKGSRQAIIDDLRTRRQFLSREGDQIDNIEVVGIYRDRIVLRSNGTEEELWLSFSHENGSGRQGGVAGATTARAPQRFEDMPALETSRFGKRIADDRWIIQRDELLNYADEVLEDPERLLALFAAMEPELGDDDEITGFRLGMLGENVLYEAAGMLDGDVVRAVNSMPMTSPARARYFISEFMNGQISAIVLDIERDGEEQKLIHLIR